MIRLKTLLLEQTNPVFKSAPVDTATTVTPFDAKKVAQLLFNTKSNFNDDEETAKKVIYNNIKNIDQYAKVNGQLKKLASNVGIGGFLRSFLNNVDRLDIIKHLITVLPKAQWNWTIIKIMPFDEFNQVLERDPSLWNIFVGNAPSTSTPVSNAELELIHFYNPELARKQTDFDIQSKQKLDLKIKDLFGFQYTAGKLALANSPIHIRALYEFLWGRTKSFTEKDLLESERKFLLAASLTHGVKHGFKYDYWRSIGAKGSLSLSTAGQTAEKSKDKSNVIQSLKSMLSPNTATSYMYFLGEISPVNVKFTPPNTVVVKDNYDFNTKEYELTFDQVVNEFVDTLNRVMAGKAPVYSVIRKAMNLRELDGYNGYPVNIILRYTDSESVIDPNWFK